MELITTHKKIASAINGLGRRLKNLDNDTHVVAVSAVTHAIEHNRNWELVTSLVKVVGNYDESKNKFTSRAVRATDMRNWLTAHLPIKWEFKKGLGRYVTDSKKLESFDESTLDLSTPWFIKVKDEGAPVKLKSTDERAALFIKAIKKDMKSSLDNGQAYDSKLSDKVAQELMQLLDLGGMIEAEIAPANDDTIAALEAVVAADKAATA